MTKIQRTVVHYGDNDPFAVTGGVETFARNLRAVFEEVVYMTPRTRNLERVRAGGLPVICDNQRTLDWPGDIPVIGFQHGVAAEKAKATRSIGRYFLSRRQRRTASRPNTLWVACAEWISERFGELYGNRADYVIYHPIDVERFDGVRTGESSNLILHDARLKHKGSRLMPVIVSAFPDWRFEALNCSPDQTNERMRGARAFTHLSRYEGNSLVCNEAMAMNLPCLFTRVGLMKDPNAPADVFVIDAESAFNDTDYLVRSVGAFLDTLGSRTYRPRQWVLENATIEKAVAKWSEVMKDFDSMRIPAR